MKINDIKYILKESKATGNNRFVKHNETQRLYIVIATHVWMNGTRHIKIRGYHELPENEWSTRIYDEFNVPVKAFKAEFSRIDSELLGTLYDVDSI